MPYWYDRWRMVKGESQPHSIRNVGHSSRSGGCWSWSEGDGRRGGDLTRQIFDSACGLVVLDSTLLALAWTLDSRSFRARSERERRLEQ